MRFGILAIMAAVALMGLAVGGAWAQGAYAGQQARAIKALSAEETENLLEGRGMGLAKAAELNRYPGPMHLMELAKELGISDADAAKIRAVHAPMRTEAQAIGQQIVAAETELDTLFAGGKADAASVAALTAKIGALQGKVRAVHLNAHLAVRPLLSVETVARYDSLRGYGGGNAPPHHGAGHRH